MKQMNSTIGLQGHVIRFKRLLVDGRSIFTLFMILRALDMVSTFVGIRKFGVSAETNPINIYLIHQFGLPLFFALNLLISALIAITLLQTFKTAKSRWYFYIFFIFTLFVLLKNFYIEIF